MATPELRAGRSCLANSKHFPHCAPPTLFPPRHFSHNPTPNSIACASDATGRRQWCWAMLCPERGEEGLELAVPLCSAFAISSRHVPGAGEALGDKQHRNG